jgi:transcriptional regulator with XRE-family HTH domain
MLGAGSIVTQLRQRGRLSLRELAARAGTSSATVSNYETGRKEPRLSTLAQLAAAAGYELVVDIRPKLTDPEHASLALGHAVAHRLHADPGPVLAAARRNLATQRHADLDGHAAAYHDAWQMLLDGPLDALIDILTTDAPLGRELRPTAPFAGLVSDAKRAAAFDDSAQSTR